MAVSKMKMLSISGKTEMMDKVAEICINSESFHPEITADALDGMARVNEENPYAAEFAQLDELCNEFGITGREVSLDGADVEELKEYIADLRDRLIGAKDHKTALADQLKKNKLLIEQLSHYESLEISLDEVFSCEFVTVRFGKIPSESYRKLTSYDDHPYIMFVPCSKEGDKLWGIYACPADHAEEVDRVFASLFFERMNISGVSGLPKDTIAKLKEENAEIEKDIANLDKRISEYFRDENDHIMQLYTYLCRKNKVAEFSRYFAQHNNYFFLMGWAPEDKADQIAAKLEKIESVEVGIDNAGTVKHIVPPTDLKNKKIFRPFEMYVKMYGLPNYNEPDPTAFVAITYTILFGIMFADLGQGLVLSLVGLFMWYKMKMALGKILVPCGIVSAFFGLAFGSVFGFEHLLDPMFHALGFEEKPIEVIDSAVMLLIAAIAIGVVLVMLAMCVNIYSSLKRRDLASALFGPNGVAGLLFYACMILVVLSLVIKMPVPTFVFGIIMAVAIVLIFLREPLAAIIKGEKHWQPESWAEYSLDNGAELFEVVLSYFSNTLSFLRVGAFVLIHAGMMLMFFKLAEYMPNAALYTLLIVFGNIFVIVLEGLLVGIQVLRLEFYEMFSRFYFGDGRDWTPVSVKNKD